MVPLKRDNTLKKLRRHVSIGSEQVDTTKNSLLHALVSQWMLSMVNENVHLAILGFDIDMSNIKLGFHLPHLNNEHPIEPIHHLLVSPLDGGLESLHNFFSISRIWVMPLYWIACG